MHHQGNSAIGIAGNEQVLVPPTTHHVPMIMKTLPALRIAFLALVLCGGAPLAFAADAKPEDRVRPEIAKYLSTAQELLRAAKPAEALLQARQAEAAKDPSAYEDFVVQRFIGAAAAGAGDTPAALLAYSRVIESGRLPKPEQLGLLEGMAGSALKLKDYPQTIKWARRHIGEGGNGDGALQALATALYLTQDFGGAAEALRAVSRADEAQKRKTREVHLRMWADSERRLGNEKGYRSMLVRILRDYPSTEVWADLLARTRSTLPQSLPLELDLYRLMRAAGVLQDAEDVLDYANTALRAGQPAEAQQVLEAGFAAGQLGSGPKVDAQRNLLASAKRAAGEDRRELTTASAVGNPAALLSAGRALVSMGQADQGLALMERAVAEGPASDEARLALGVAQWQAGRKQAAMQSWAAVKGSDAAAEVTQLWVLYAKP